MTTPIAFHNGVLIPATELLLSPTDMGFMLGITVAEQLRTFSGKLFQWDDHIARMRNCLTTLGFDQGDLVDGLHQAAAEVVAHNHALLDPGDDLGLCIFFTPGDYPAYAPGQPMVPNIGIHSYPLPFAMWAGKYEAGQRCVVASVPQISRHCWPRDLKCRSRTHYYLADQEARRVHPEARAILLDDASNVNEASTANVIAYSTRNGLTSPPKENILPGVSLSFVEQLAGELNIAFAYRDLSVDELLESDEVMLTSTPFCLVHACSINGRTFRQKEITRQLLRAWSEHVGFDIAEQSRHFTTRS